LLRAWEQRDWVSPWRIIDRMRSVQAAPGVTRSCIGCHEHKFDAPPLDHGIAGVLAREPDRPGVLSTVQRAWMEVAATALADPYRLPYGMAWWVFERLREWSPHMSLQAVDSAASAQQPFRVNLDGGDPPAVAKPECRCGVFGSTTQGFLGRQAEVRAGQRDLIRIGGQQRIDHGVQHGLTFRCGGGVRLDQCHPIRRDARDHADMGSVFFGHAAEQLAIGGSPRGDHADHAGLRALGSGLDRRFNANNGNPREALAQRMQRGGAGGMARQYDHGAARRQQMIHDRVDIAAQLGMGAFAIRQMRLIRIIEGGDARQLGVNFAQDRQAAHAGVQHADHDQTKY